MPWKCLPRTKTNCARRSNNMQHIIFVLERRMHHVFVFANPDHVLEEGKVNNSLEYN